MWIVYASSYVTFAGRVYFYKEHIVVPEVMESGPALPGVIAYIYFRQLTYLCFSFLIYMIGLL